MKTRGTAHASEPTSLPHLCEQVSESPCLALCCGAFGAAALSAPVRARDGSGGEHTDVRVIQRFTSMMALVEDVPQLVALAAVTTVNDSTAAATVITVQLCSAAHRWFTNWPWHVTSCGGTWTGGREPPWRAGRAARYSMYNRSAAQLTCVRQGVLQGGYTELVQAPPRCSVLAT